MPTVIPQIPSLCGDSVLQRIREVIDWMNAATQHMAIVFPATYDAAITLRFDVRGNVAGYYNHDKGKNHTIRLNLHHMVNHPEETLNTIYHELAHLIVHCLGGPNGHGFEFHAAYFGLTGGQHTTMCHSMPRVAARSAAPTFTIDDL